MGYYYADRPPERGVWWKKLIPGWLKRFWADSQEVIVITQVVFGLLLPILGVLIGFIVVFAGLVFLLGRCTGSG